ncbi:MULTISPECIES: hypothetical protein [Burkholderia]|uniref:hypothetical protein n=1 Tax=Burkholderia TaxID=32008 RepID=UPI000BF701D2|nr:hypothetical protein [Burkholderia sp. JKS000303]PFH12892.1 hypothetical protein BX604_7312 [Burkholderia sp. JKS000303]
MFSWLPRRKQTRTPFQVGYDKVMEAHHRGVRTGAIFITVANLDAYGKWPDEVRGSWKALEDICNQENL